MVMKDIAKFLLEVGSLKNVRRSGWFVAGVKNPESISDHSMRAIITGYLIAKEERADEEKVMKMLMFHDVPETRLGDMHKVTAKYIDKQKAEKNVVEDQSKMLSKEAGKEYIELMKELAEGRTKEAKIAIDADYLECAIQAHEYMENGYKNAREWIERVRAELKTETAKQILEEVVKSEFWWKGLKKMH